MMQPSVDDNLLFLRIQQNNRDAFNALFVRYYTRLCVLADTFVKNKEDAEEVVADVFFTLWKSRNSLTIQNMQAYLYSSVKYGSMARVRKRRVHQHITGEIENTPDHVTEDAYATKELIEHIDLAVEQLPLRCKQVFIMNRFHGMRYKEIAEALGISEKTVEHHLARGVQHVRNFIRQYYHEPESGVMFS